LLPFNMRRIEPEWPARQVPVESADGTRA
jgi:hypothetical protein